MIMMVSSLIMYTSPSLHAIIDTHDEKVMSQLKIGDKRFCK